MDAVMDVPVMYGIELGPEVYYCLTAVELCDPRSVVVEWWCRKTK